MLRYKLSPEYLAGVNRCKANCKKLLTIWQERYPEDQEEIAVLESLVKDFDGLSEGGVDE